MKKWGAALAIATTLSACQATTGRLSVERVGPPPPAGTRVPTQAVDGLIVGHRLMAAGQYELALDAYIRAAGKHGMTADVLSAMGAANLKLGRLPEARVLLERALEKDPRSVPAWNNLGVVLMAMGRNAEAQRDFRIAYGLDNGNSDQIRENLRMAIAKTQNSSYDEPKKNKFNLVRRGSGRYLLLRTPEKNIEQ